MNSLINVLKLVFAVVIINLCACQKQAPRLGNHIPLQDSQHYSPPPLGISAQSPPLKESTLPAHISKAKQLMAQRRFLETKNLLNQLSHQPVQDREASDEKLLLTAELALQDNTPQKALSILKHIHSLSTLSVEEKISFHELQADAHAMLGNYLASAKERVALEPLLTDYNIKQNQEKIWQLVQRIDADTLAVVANKELDAALKGWLKLAQATQTDENSPQMLLAALTNWQKTYPDHPGNAMLPANTLAMAKPLTATKVALLLPTESGPLARMAKVVRDGFMTAYQLDSHTDKPTIFVLDTANDKNVTRTYQQAIAKGADFAVGPLTKNGLNQLANLNELPIPVLGLNTTQSAAHLPLYQFGLSPEDEARQVVNLAWSQGYNNALIIALNNDWGERVANAYQAAWLAKGGHVIDTVKFTSRADLTGPIKNLLHINESQSRARQMSQILGEKVKSTPRRRQDIDVIFLASFANQARQIRPLLSFYYANKVPVFSTASIYSGTPNPSADRDLNNITFCDMPWILTPQKAEPALQSMLKELWPKSAALYPRLFALGVDAYKLLPHMDRLNNFPDIGYKGVTGKLLMSQEKRIVRQLPCATFKKGLVVTLANR